MGVFSPLGAAPEFGAGTAEGAPVQSEESADLEIARGNIEGAGDFGPVLKVFDPLP